jgi:hypothetical protein
MHWLCAGWYASVSQIDESVKKMVALRDARARCRRPHRPIDRRPAHAGGRAAVVSGERQESMASSTSFWESEIALDSLS